MEQLLQQVESLQLLNHFLLSLFIIIPMVLIARTVVAGTRYSPILIIVIFGLAMGFVLVSSGVAEPGLKQFPVVELISKTTSIALIVTFFVGGQEIRKIFGNKEGATKDLLIHNEEEAVLGTTRTQMVLIVRSFFLLIGMEALSRIILDLNSSPLSNYYPIMAYLGLVGSIILIDSKAKILEKPLYIRKGVLEIIVITGILIFAYHLSVFVNDLVALPSIFFAMVIATVLGLVCYDYVFGPTIKALLFAGIPVVLAGNFTVGGSRIIEVFDMEGAASVLGYGFFGQVFWMFGGMALLMYFGKTQAVRNLAPGMAGALSHTGLTGACTAGDLGKRAANRAPMLVNIPFAMHIFVFSILAMSSEKGSLLMIPAIIASIIGFGLLILGLKNIKKPGNDDKKEMAALLQFGFGWQLIAIFGGLIMLSFSSMSLDFAAMAKASAISHFGLFAAIQEGMFGSEAAGLITFTFSMTFLVHPFVFFMFGKAMENNEEMPKLPVYILSIVGFIGIVGSIIFL
ncbi:hypothetical protein SAMN05421839_101113 [Halolactibacillus halophilus]|uniref:Uncharacterized protein n=1 Tax=Halolactibacillus halophilus TaxID=306540 RepID=A0A1I5KYW8_9BACI|nr:hypothetical protein [Halolactibacillus halophilus]GEM00569.1 hypothetical protein HHA03_01010 [Halolactibacillus halophilus]SFO90274.1 hypothetical protein SAMN05421839_101113 [Halolactibacillus halophilus]